MPLFQGKPYGLYEVGRRQTENKQTDKETHTFQISNFGRNLKLYRPKIKQPTLRMAKIPKTATISRMVTIPMMVTILRIVTIPMKVILPKMVKILLEMN